LSHFDSPEELENYLLNILDIFLLCSNLFRHLFQCCLITQHYNILNSIYLISLHIGNQISIQEQSISVTYGTTIDRSAFHWTKTVIELKSRDSISTSEDSSYLLMR